MKLACVVHRFGADIAGGSEGHCRAIAERLAINHDVTVLTTTAKDHVTWAPVYPPGESGDGGIRVRRFPAAPRSMQLFFDLTDEVFEGGASEEREEAWFRENGPQTPELLEYLRQHGQEFDRILFWSFRYYQTFFGLPIVASRAILVPTAEEDPAIRLGIVDSFFALPSGYIFLTPEEQALVARRCRQPLPPSCVAGTGLEPAASPSEAGLASVGVRAPFVLYLGRIDPNKGCETLLRHFQRFSDEARDRSSPEAEVPLVMAGPANMPIPDHPMVKHLGYVTGEVRESLLAHASALVMPSRYESLSLVLLEAWNHGTPALVNGRCQVLNGQAHRSGGALTYRDFDEFSHGLRYLLSHHDEARAIGRQGLAYVDREYRWPHVMNTIETFLGSLPPA